MKPGFGSVFLHGRQCTSRISRAASPQRPCEHWWHIECPQERTRGGFIRVPQLAHKNPFASDTWNKDGTPVEVIAIRAKPKKAARIERSRKTGSFDTQMTVHRVRGFWPRPKVPCCWAQRINEDRREESKQQEQMFDGSLEQKLGVNNVFDGS